MITRRKAALLQALPQSSLEAATPVKTKTEKFEGGEAPGGQELLKKMQVISLSSDSEQDDDDDSEENSESDYSDEKEASAMSQSSDDECTIEKDDRSEVVQRNKESIPISIDFLIAEKVLQVIKEGGDLKKLTVDSCRAYLRHHGLRISGNKQVLIDRIKQHIELKQGVPEKYRAATFTINCTGDVCKGDVIKFKQKVYKKFSVAKRSADAVGERVVVGRVVKESYGEKRQQHTFTVEVLWSAGYKPLSPMRQLLVKGRNLYRLRTYRQKWEDEKLRKISLDEKHERGAAARSKRRETLRTSGPPKITVGGRKQLRNPYVATGLNINFPPDLLGGRGSGGPLHRSWFPRYPSFQGQADVLPPKPMMPQHSGFDAIRETVNHHSNQSAGVAHDIRVQPPRIGTKSALDADPTPNRTRNENTEGYGQSPSIHCFRFASTASKECVNLQNMSAAGVPADTHFGAPRLESPIVSGTDWRRREIMSPHRSNSDARREEAKCINNSSAGMPQSTRVQIYTKESRVSGSVPAENNKQIENKSPGRSDINRWSDVANNRNILVAGGGHDSRSSPLRLQSRVFSGGDPGWRQNENRSPQSSDVNRWRDESRNTNIPASGIPQNTGASPHRLQRKIVPWTDPYMDRKQNENKSPLSKDASYYQDPIAGVPSDILALSTRTEIRNFAREDPHSVVRHNDNRSPWRVGPNGWRRDGYHHIDHMAAVPHLLQVQLARTLNNCSGNDSLDRRQTENRSPRRWDSNLSRTDVGQQNHSPRRGQFSPLGKLSSDDQFMCQVLGCLNLGSKSCSYRKCVRCCQQQGQYCANSKHRSRT